MTGIDTQPALPAAPWHEREVFARVPRMNLTPPRDSGQGLNYLIGGAASMATALR